jgi:hypothetical protein
MQQAYNELSLLVSKSKPENEYFIPPAGNVTVHNLQHLNILSVQYKSSEFPLISKHLIDLGFVKFFENYWVSPTWMQQENEWILEDFFSFIAPIYESKFHYKNNISCCDHLINLALKHKISDKSITLDFGSGTGIIIDSSFVSKLESIIGFDFCGEMRKLSRNRGMRTLSVFEFNSLPSNQFDIIILNYVLHLGISFNSLNHLLKFLVQGGVLVGNIHKDLGVNIFRDWLGSLLVNKFSHQIETSQHGSIIIIKKI